MRTMGTIQTNADRTIIAIGHRLTYGLRHYRPECDPAIRTAVADLARPDRYETNHRAADAQELLTERGHGLWSRQEIASASEATYKGRILCTTCLEVIR